MTSQDHRAPWNDSVCVGRIYHFGLGCGVSAMADLALFSPMNLYLSSVIFFGYAIWLTVQEVRSSSTRVNPLVTYQLWQALTLGLGPLGISILYGTDDNVAFGDRFLTIAEVAFGHAIMVVGAWGLYAGMSLFRPPAKRHVKTASDPLTLVTVFVIGAAAHLFREQITQFAGSAIAGISYMSVAALCVLAVNPPSAIRRNTAVLGSVLMFGCLAQVLLAARRDSKMEITLAFFPWMLWLLHRKKIIALVFSTFTLASTYLLILAPLVMGVRLAATREEQVISVLESDATQTVGREVQESLSSNVKEYLDTWVEVTVNRLSDPIAAGQVAILAHQDGFQLGQSWGYILTNFIPRIFWRDKPLQDRGRVFTAKMGWAADASTATSSTGETSAGELYWNFGWPGVILGMLCLGVMVSYCWWGAAGTSPEDGALEMTAFISATLSFVMGTGAAAGPLFVGCISMGILFRVLILIRQRSGRSGRSSRVRERRQLALMRVKVM